MSRVWLSLAELQLLLAGFAILLAAQQASVWRWEGRSSTARWVVLSACATAAVFLTSYGSLHALSLAQDVEGLLYARSAALALLSISVLPVAGSLANRRPPRLLVAFIVVTLLVRLVLWPTTDLIFRHELVNGLPSYGPLMAPTSLAVIILVFGYLCFVAGHGPSDRERLLLSLGIAGSLMLAVVSVAAGDPMAAEVASGYIPLPALVAIAASLWMRQFNAFRAVRCLAERQRALASLSRLALTADLNAVEASAGRAIGLHTGAEQDQPDQNAEFAAAVEAVVAAARQHHQANEKLQRWATTDDLTQLPNRAALRAIINRALRDSADSGGTIAVALCGLDRFRAVNDVHGHPAGDEVLDAVGRRLVDVAHACDVVGRFGGDEFVVVCTDVVDGEGVAAFGQRLTSVFERPVVTRLVDASITASVGIVTVTPGTTDGTDADTLLRDADTAMYDAKDRGGAVIGEFHDGLRSAVVYRADLERRLRGAVARGEILVHYQPIVRLSDRSVVGFEALARWQQGDQLLPPNDWIPVAESTGLIHEIGRRVLSEAVEQLGTWLDAGHRIGMSINVSPRQLASQRFLDEVHSALATGVPPELLTLEVTESLAVDEQATSLLRDIHLTGVRIAIDDFGTGYSALAAVSRLPIDVLKIDRSIVRRAAHRDGRAVLAAVLAMADSLELSTVAEGIESPEDERRLLELGCQFAQGFLFQRPLAPEQAERILEQPVPSN